MNNELKLLIDEFIDVIYTENWTLVNSMASDLLNFLLEKNITDGLERIILLLSEVEYDLNLRNKLYLKELKFKIIRSEFSDNGYNLESKDKKRHDKYGEIKVENISGEEINYRMSSCQVDPSELPRVPGETYRLLVKNSDLEYYSLFTILEDGTIQETREDNATELTSGFNQIFSGAIENKE